MKFIIYGEPVAKGRPRLRRWGGTYTPPKTAKAEQNARQYLATQYKAEPIDKPIEVRFTFYLPVPKSYTKKQRAEIEKNKFFHTKKADIDNYCKLYLDAMNGLIYRDDAIICMLSAIKLYTYGTPRVEVEINEIH